MSLFAPISYPAAFVFYVVCGLCCAVVVVAAITDLRSRLIPNWLTFSAIVLGLLINGILGGTHGISVAFVGLLIGGAVFLPFFLFGGFGGGDVKLMAAVGALVGLKLVLASILLTGVAGALVAIIAIARRGAWGSTLGNFGRLVRLKQVEPPPGEQEALSVPYGTAIALGTIGAIVLELVGRPII